VLAVAPRRTRIPSRADIRLSLIPVTDSHTVISIRISAILGKSVRTLYISHHSMWTAGSTFPLIIISRKMDKKLGCHIHRSSLACGGARHNCYEVCTAILTIIQATIITRFVLHQNALVNTIITYIYRVFTWSQSAYIFPRSTSTVSV
jgi:hypothetical protein